MKINHLAIWTNHLEQLRHFYQEHFNMTSGNKYENLNTGFTSYFLSFEGEGVRQEIMSLRESSNLEVFKEMHYGLAHFAVSVGSKEEVDNFTERLRSKGVMVIREPRTTGDGYYESVVLDPDGNRIEITV